MIETIRARVSTISAGAFLQGLAVVVLLYAALFFFLTLTGPAVLKSSQSKLASKIVPIGRAEPPVPDVPLQDEVRVWPPVDESIPPGALVPAPVSGLYEETPAGDLPRAAPDGRTPFKAYKRPFAASGFPLIVLAVADYGLSDKISESLALLPGDVSLVLNPYAPKAAEWQTKARENGHETWIQIPLATADGRYDPGPQGILGSQSLQDNMTRLHWALSRASGYAGVAAFSDGGIPGARAVLDDVFGRGLGWFELNPDAAPDVETLAASGNVPYVKNAVFADPASLEKLEAAAREDGYAVALINPTPAGVAALQVWIETLSGKGFSMAPVSAIVEARQPKPVSPPASEGTILEPAAEIAPVPAEAPHP